MKSKTTTIEETEERQGNNGKIKELLSWAFTFLAAILMALFIKTFIIINATVPTGSMENTIVPGDDIIGFRLAYTFSEPERGDIIIFKNPNNLKEKYVKRVIGLPGDTVVIEDSKVYINGAETPLDEPYLKEEWVVCNGPFTYEVPEDSYFVMGDNRNTSFDSRRWTGETYVSRDKVLAKAVCIYFPFNHMRGL